MTIIDRITQRLRRDRVNSALAIAILGAAIIAPSSARADATVNLCHTADDPGSGTNLRTALSAQPDPNSLINNITFLCGGPATIEVGSPLVISQATSIDGFGNITLVGTNRISLIVVADPGYLLHVRNLTLRQPNSAQNPCPGWLANECVGSVVYGHGVTELHNVRVDSSHIPIAVISGSLGVYDGSQFTGNSEAVIAVGSAVTSTTIDQAMFKDNPGAAPFEATGAVKITNSQFSNNAAAVLDGTCQVTIDRSTFEDNKSNGALAVNSCATTISNSTFANNTSTLFGGAILFDFGTQQITLRADKFLNNSGGHGGGAVFWRPPANMDRTLTILYSTFAGNTAESGGAIDVDNSVNSTGKTVIQVGVTSFSRNVATGAGGAINAVSSELAIVRGAFADNKAAGNGGAVFVSNSAPLQSTFANSLFVRNSAASGSAFYGDDADFTNSTADSNVGLAIANNAPHPPVQIKFTNSIVSNNLQGGCGPAGLFDNSGHNLQFPGADCGASITVANPQLDTMYIPLPGSPPMGNADLNVCMSPPINGRDVYGMARPSGGACTIGAAEGDIEARIQRRTRR